MNESHTEFLIQREIEKDNWIGYTHPTDNLSLVLNRLEELRFERPAIKFRGVIKYTTIRVING